MTSQERIGLRLMRKRVDLGYTQQEVAGFVGVRDATTIMNWECGTKDPATRYLIRLARLYCVTPDWILNFNGEADEYDNQFVSQYGGFRRKEDL